MPLMNSTGAFKQQHFFSTTSTGPTNYIDTLTGGTGILPRAGDFTSTGGSLIVGMRSNSGATTGFVFSTTNDGTFSAQTFIDGTGVSFKSMDLRDIVVDSSNNGYVVGGGYQDTSGVNALIFKVNSSASLVWQKTLSSTQADTFTCIDIAGSNLYVGGSYYTGTAYAPILASYDTSGNLQFQKTFANCSSVSSIATDSSNNYYVVANESITGSIDGIQITKWDNTNTFQWGKRIYGASDYSDGSAVKVDSSGNVYVLMRIINYVYLLKFNSSGTIQWQKRFDTVVDYVGGMTIDDTGNIYVNLFPLNPCYIIKISPSGTIVWQNSLTVSPNYFNAPLYVNLSWRFNTLLLNVSKAGSGVPGFVLSLPDNGTKTGTYSPYFTYATSSTTISTSSLNIATQLNTSSSLSLTNATSTFPTSTGNITQSVTQI